MMPGLNGFDTCRLIKRNTVTCDIPVIFMTALSDLDSILAAFQAGGVDYLIKPLQFEEVLVRVNTHLSLRAAQRQLIEKNEALEKANTDLVQALEQLKSAQSQLVLAERMATIGQLAAGVAHEINNPLSIVRSNLGAIASYAEDLDRVFCANREVLAPLAAELPAAKLALDLARQVAVDDIMTDFPLILSEMRFGCARIQKIVEDFRYFARPGEGEGWMAQDLEKSIDGTLKLMPDLDERIKVVCDYAGIPEVECQPALVNLALINLIANAVQAIEHQGTVEVHTRQEADTVVISIVDDGIGIAPENLSRIFEPFFTTKPAGQGAGLGLTLVSDIVHEHRGEIRVDNSVPGKTCFRLSLPIRRRESAAA
jgi:signal transduction histidine kinase